MPHVLLGPPAEEASSGSLSSQTSGHNIFLAHGRAADFLGVLRISSKPVPGLVGLVLVLEGWSHKPGWLLSQLRPSQLAPLSSLLGAPTNADPPFPLPMSLRRNLAGESQTGLDGNPFQKPQQDKRDAGGNNGTGGWGWGV